MHAKCLSIKGLSPPRMGGGTWRMWCLILPIGIRQHPPGSCGGVKCLKIKNLNNIRHLDIKRID
jgi:hypothetical protein